MKSGNSAGKPRDRIRENKTDRKFMNKLLASVHASYTCISLIAEMEQMSKCMLANLHSIAPQLQFMIDSAPHQLHFVIQIPLHISPTFDFYKLYMGITFPIFKIMYIHVFVNVEGATSCI